MERTRDCSQYGNQNTAVDTNSQDEAFAVILSMVDWSQAFDRQSHYLGIKSFIQNGVRPSLIPVLMDFFQNRRIVKWKGVKSYLDH